MGTLGKFLRFLSIMTLLTIVIFLSFFSVFERGVEKVSLFTVTTGKKRYNYIHSSKGA